MIGAIVLTLRTRPGVRKQSIAVQNARDPALTMEVVDVKPGQGA
jgi:NADH-quinone oxidoreductase subunit J